MRIQTEPYRTPEGKADFPFAYVADLTAAPDGLAQVQNIALQLQGDSEFILRSIRGVNLCVAAAPNGRFNYRNASDSYANGNPSSGIIMPPNWPVLPEKVYPVHNSAIHFDLYNTLRAFTACGQTPIYTSYIAFFGVKRFPGATPQTPYRYWEQKYGYTFDLTIDWNHFDATGAAAPPRRFFVLMDRYDFELMRISVTNNTAGVQRGAPAALTTDDFQIMAYDPNMRQFSSLPLNILFVNSGRPTAATAPQYQPALAPSVVYPVGSAITFDITSMLCNAVAAPQLYNILFEGIWRIPTSGRL